MMRILVCGEGPHDVGSTEWDAKTSSVQVTEGWLQPIVRKLVMDDLVIESKLRHEILILPKLKNKYKPLPKGHGEKALAAGLQGLIGNYDHVIYMVDNDSKETKKWQETVQEIEVGFSTIDPSNENIACVPMSTSECWILADAEAWKLALDVDVTAFKKPEALWGVRNDPKDNHPKHVFARACAAAGVSDDRDTRQQVSCHINVETLTCNCPISFQPFLEAVKGAISRPTTPPDTAT